MFKLQSAIFILLVFSMRSSFAVDRLPAGASSEPAALATLVKLMRRPKKRMYLMHNCSAR